MEFFFLIIFFFSTVKKYNIFIFWQTCPPPEDTQNRSPAVPPPRAVTSVKVREDPANIDRYIQDAVVYVDTLADDEWVDCFKLNGDTDPAAYSYDRDGILGALAIHVDDAITCGNDEFYTTVLVLLLGQFSISKL